MFFNKSTCKKLLLKSMKNREFLLKNSLNSKQLFNLLNKNRSTKRFSTLTIIRQ